MGIELNMDWEDGIQDDDPREELLVTLPRVSPETDTEEIRKITQSILKVLESACWRCYYK